jgi:hypothetical protein
MMNARNSLVGWAVSSVGLPLFMVSAALFKLPYWPLYDLISMGITCSRAILLGILVKKVFDHKDLADFLRC